MSVTKLLLYNNALTDIGERALADLTEDREPRRILDIAWDTGAVDWCLEQGQWAFAIRGVKLEYNPAIQPAWGYNRAFDKPSDYIRLAGICSDEFFNAPITGFVDEADHWYTTLDSIYVRYVSNDLSYGFDMNKWPQTFGKLVIAYLASEIVSKITQGSTKVAACQKNLEKMLVAARSADALNQPTAFAPPGTWTMSRRGRRGFRDKGSRGQLIG